MGQGPTALLVAMATLGRGFSATTPVTLAVHSFQSECQVVASVSLLTARHILEVQGRSLDRPRMNWLTAGAII